MLSCPQGHLHPIYTHATIHIEAEKSDGNLVKARLFVSPLLLVINKLYENKHRTRSSISGYGSIIHNRCLWHNNRMTLKRVNRVYVVSTGRTEQPHLFETLYDACVYILNN